jgi:YidC/Oxa1 family membrane protein insertase
MFDAFFNAIAWLLAWFYDLPAVGYGGAIALLTITIMVIVTPLNVKATKSMMTMSALAPEMKRIQQEFADDRQRMNEELLGFYRENKINPLGGCLPMLLQIPFFIVLYQVIYGLTRRAGDATTVVVQGQQVTVEAGEFLPKYLDQFPDSQLYADLVGSTSMDSFGIDLSRSAAAALQDSFAAGFPYMVLILVVAGTAFLQQKQMSMRNPNAEMPPQQKILLRVLPVFFAFISFNFAAGLVVYFFVSNLYRIAQNAVISMRLYNLSFVPALLGVGEANLSAGRSAAAGAADSKPVSGKSGSTPDSGSKGSGSKGSGGRTTPPKGRSDASSNGSKSSGSKPSGSKSSSSTSGGQSKQRPPSGRVTPPKNGSGARGGASPERRRKKKRA